MLLLLLLLLLLIDSRGVLPVFLMAIGVVLLAVAVLS